MKCLIVNPVEVVLGIHYHQMNRKCLIGGKKKDSVEMDEVARMFTNRRLSVKFPAVNRMRIEFRISNDHFVEGLKRVKEAGWVMEKVTSFGRLMR